MRVKNEGEVSRLAESKMGLEKKKADVTVDKLSVIITELCSQTTQGEKRCTVTRNNSKHFSSDWLNTELSEQRHT